MHVLPSERMQGPQLRKKNKSGWKTNLHQKKKQKTKKRKFLPLHCKVSYFEKVPTGRNLNNVFSCHQVAAHWWSKKLRPCWLLSYPFVWAGSIFSDNNKNREDAINNCLDGSIPGRSTDTNLRE